MFVVKIYIYIYDSNRRHEDRARDLSSDFQKKRLEIDGEMNRKKSLRYLISRRRSIINLIDVESLLTTF